ncbi:MAG: AAA family ATPase [Desulfobacteraceae bacterium]|nr:AAA family ATPase [Desulfobacteraceae bacterium]
MDITGYRITEKIEGSSKALVCRATRLADNKPFTLKISGAGEPGEIVRLKQEFHIASLLHRKGIKGECFLEKHGNQLFLACEHYDGEPLAALCSLKKPNLEETLTIAIKIVRELSAIHSAGIIHKDINPSNIIYDLRTGLLEIINFGISTTFAQEKPFLQNNDLPQGSLAYISPEQTGRMNRVLDFRTDFYSLGATLYELLCSRPPFPVEDPLEMLHCHIAKQPVPVHLVNGDIFEALSMVVMKLLAKNADDRYSSAQGIINDLEKCLGQVRDDHFKPFVPGQGDMADTFRVSQKLYGRVEESKKLHQAFERSVQGASESLLIGGYAGCGKTTLVREIHRPVTASRSYFIEGKFDRLAQNIPYGAMIQAFAGLVRIYLSQEPDQLKAIQEKLLKGLAGYGRLMIDHLPELELIIGKQPPVPVLGIVESRNRFNMVLKRFLRACCNPGRPLTIFLDDMQWADLSTLGLFERISTDPDYHNLFFICAFRDNEVDPGHPLMHTLDEIKKRGGEVNMIGLGPLSPCNIREMVADTLHASLEKTEPLAELIVRKTDGNPFFVTQFLKTLYKEKAITFDYDHKCWTWDLNQIDAMGSTDNVADLMLRKLEGLPQATVHILRQAACIGNRFDLDSLSVIRGTSLEHTYNDLLPAEKEGLVHPLSGLESSDPEILDSPLIVKEHKFLHDRVQEAAYALIPKDQLREMHLRMGRLMLNYAANRPGGRDKYLFDITNHLNLGSSLITGEKERVELAELNLEAGIRARESNAWQAASGYAGHGLMLLPAKGMWAKHYRLVLELNLLLADCEVFAGNFKRAEAIFKKVLEQMDDEIDKTRIYERLLQVHISNSRMEEAILLTVSVLNRWGIEVTTNPTREEWLKEESRFQKLLAGRKTDELLNLPKIDNEKMEAALRLLMQTFPPAYQIRAKRPWCMETLMTLMMNIGLEYGHSDISAHAYAAYTCCITDGHRYRDAWEYGRLAIALNEKNGNCSIKGKVYLFVTFFAQFWREHFSKCEPFWKEGYSAALGAGDFIHVAFALLNKTSLRIAQSVNLAELEQETLDAIGIARRTNYPLMLYIIRMNLNLIRNLMGRTTGVDSLDSDDLTEKEYLDFMTGQKSAMGFAYYGVAKLMSLYLSGKYREAIAFGEKFEDNMLSVPGMVVLAEHGFYYALAITACYGRMDGAEKEKYSNVLEGYLEKARIWAENCPENFLNRYLVIQAEKARIQGRGMDAVDLYEQAATAARENRFINMEALANELAAKYWLEQGNSRYSHLHLQDALLGYGLWGAGAKVRGLSEKYPLVAMGTVLPASRAGDDASGMEESRTPPERDLNLLDLSAVFKATQAISGEILLEKLVEKLLKIVLESAGAQRAVLLVKSGTQLKIEARAGERPKHTGGRELPWSMVRYTGQTKKEVLLNNAARDHEFINDPYIVQNNPLSVLCLPVLKQDKLVAVLYLENDLTTGAFTRGRLELLKIICSQAAISLENSLLYKRTEEVTKNLLERETQLEEKTKSLEELNTALKVLVEKVNTEREQVEKHLYFNVNDLVMPFVEKLEQSGLTERQQVLVTTIRENLDRIAAPFLMEKSVVELKLTPMEMQVANMIKHGKTGRQMAETLNLSFNTIETHKKNLRKKLGLTGKKISLKKFLISE